MAIFTPGVAVGQISGRVGGNVFSHNRGGQYIRNGSIPTNPDTPYRAQIKGWLAEASQHWLSLSQAQRTAWNEYASNNPWINRLGRSISLNGQQTCVQLNARILGVAGTKIDIPPLSDPPAAIGGVTLTADIGSGDFELAWTTGALATGLKLYCRGVVLPSSTITYVKNKWRHFLTSAAAATSPADLSTAFPARFGTLQAGQIAGVEYRVIDPASGLQSSIAWVAQPITDTP